MKDKVIDSKRSQLILKVIKSIGRMSGNVIMSSPHCTLTCAKEDKGEHKESTAASPWANYRTSHNSVFTSINNSYLMGLLGNGSYMCHSLPKQVLLYLL